MSDKTSVLPRRPRPAPRHNTQMGSADRPRNTTNDAGKASRDGYEVGYRKPPKATQFKPGKSGNPKGRPRGAKSLKTLIPELLREKVAVIENGKTRIMTKREIAGRQLIRKAIAGDPRAFETLLDLDNDGERQINQKEDVLSDHERAIFDRLFSEDGSKGAQ